jgi:hypothetical protein
VLDCCTNTVSSRICSRFVLDFLASLRYNCARRRGYARTKPQAPVLIDNVIDDWIVYVKQIDDAAHRGHDGLEYSQKASEGKYVPTAPRKSREAGPYDPVPKTWTPEHVLRRIIEAFHLDRRIAKGGPAHMKCGHPTISYTPEEIAAWEKIPLDPDKWSLSIEETTKMEKAFGWLTSLAADDYDASYALKLWTLCKASNRSIRKMCKLSGVHPRTVRYRMDRALEKIVGSVQFDPVW